MPLVILKKTSVVMWIIQINILVFFLWYLSLLLNSTFMVLNFLVSWDAVWAGRFWTLLTSVFSHNLFFHLFLNMYFFYGFGKVLEATLGGGTFLRLYLTSGLLGSLGHCFLSTFLLHQPQLLALGASGAISGVLVFFALNYPKERVYLLGLIPMPAIWGIFLFVGLDLTGLIAQTLGSEIPIGYGAHLGGAVGGAINFFVYRSTDKRNYYGY